MNVINRKLLTDTRNCIKKHSSKIIDIQNDSNKIKQVECDFTKIKESVTSDWRTVHEILDRTKEITNSRLGILRVEFKPCMLIKNNLLNSDMFTAEHYQTKEIEILREKFNVLETKQQAFFNEIQSNKESLFSIERQQIKEFDIDFKKIDELKKHNLEFKLNEYFSFFQSNRISEDISSKMDILEKMYADEFLEQNIRTVLQDKDINIRIKEFNKL
ncbi:hypothetical protein HZS_5061 [Henneguya salminicola]|nr:hypothetical protein HZS_5061 [Henneguya salminicola]